MYVCVSSLFVCFYYFSILLHITRTRSLSYMSYLYLLSVCVFYIFSISYHSFICYYVIIVTVCILKWKNEGKKLCFSCSMHYSGSIRIYIYIDISCISTYTNPSIFCHPLFWLNCHLLPTPILDWSSIAIPFHSSTQNKHLQKRPNQVSCV